MLGVERVRPSSRRDLHERVDRDRTAGDDDERVEVHAPDVGPRDREVGEAGDHRDEGVAVDRRLAPELAEELLGVEIVDELGGVDRA